MVYAMKVEIKRCLRCGGEWCYYGTGRPMRCGRCKSPYWDKERGNVDIRRGGVESAGPAERSGGGVGVSVVRAGEPEEKPAPACRACEGTLRVIKGKLVCCVVGCSMEGVEQGAAEPAAQNHAGHRIFKAGERRYCMTCGVYF
jgi:hypothetical protein